MDADVIVVGAGLAGLRCARGLQEAGRQVILLEAEDHVGGRVTSEDVDGFVVDRGFQVLNPAYPAVRRWVDVDALALSSFDAGVLVRTGRHGDGGLRVVGDPRRTPGLTVDTLRSGLLDLRDLWGLGRWLTPVLTRPQVAVTGRDTTMAAALDDLGVRGDLRRVLDRFIAGVVVDPDGATSSHFVRLLLRSFALGRPALPEGGMRRLPEQLAHGLADVRTGVPVKAVRSAATGRPGVDTEGGVLTARDVVVATQGVEAARLTGRPPVAMNGLTTWWFAADRAPDLRRLVVVDGRGAAAPPGPVWNAAVVSVVAPSYAPTGRPPRRGHDPPRAPRRRGRRAPGAGASRGHVRLRHRQVGGGGPPRDPACGARDAAALAAHAPGRPRGAPVRLRRPPRHRVHPGGARLRSAGGPRGAGSRLSRGRAGRVPGHQNRSPSRNARAGTRTVRTTKVSRSTPTQTMMPTWVRTISGSTPRTAKTAASRMPALVITPPVAGKAAACPSLVPVLAPPPGHG